MHLANYDSWLEDAYQRDLDEQSRYDSALENETLHQRELLEAAPVSALLEQHDILICKIADITTGAPRTDGRVTIDLDSVIYTLAEQLAVAVLAEPPEIDEPDGYEPDIDKDCDYWSNLK